MGVMTDLFGTLNYLKLVTSIFVGNTHFAP